MTDAAREPLRVGVLGAARIAPLSIVSPAKATGTRLVAVAARARSRAEAFAAEHGLERVLDDYQAVIDDPEVEAVYNPTPHGLHAPWNKRILAAGKHVLTEKPSAANADEAREVAAAVAQATTSTPDMVYMEAFHYPYHPLFHRVLELLREGAIGEIRHIDVPLLMPDPGADDPRWLWDLAGGSVMDLGCYSLSCLMLIGREISGGAPTITSARADERAGHPGVDERFFAQVTFPSGATGSGGSDMAADDWAFTLVVTGTEGEIAVPQFPLPHQDDRLILRRGADRVSEPRTRTHPRRAPIWSRCARAIRSSTSGHARRTPTNSRSSRMPSGPVLPCSRMPPSRSRTWNSSTARMPPPAFPRASQLLPEVHYLELMPTTCAPRLMR